MFIIPINFKWKEYPHSPRATKYSKILGILLSGAMTSVCCFFWAGILGFILMEGGTDEESAYLISFATLPVLLLGRFYLKKNIEARIEVIAQRDMQMNFLENFNNLY